MFIFGICVLLENKPNKLGHGFGLRIQKIRCAREVVPVHPGINYCLEGRRKAAGQLNDEPSLE